MSLWSLFHRSTADEADTPRAVVIGSPCAIRHTRRVLRGAKGAAKVVGAVFTKPVHHAGAVGMRVLGTCDELDLVIRTHRINVAYVSIPVAMHKLAGRIKARLEELGVAVRRMPTLGDQIDGRIGHPAGQIDVHDLLDRPHHRLDEPAIVRVLEGRRVLITGAGGSIGSQIARIVARFNPEKILLMDRSENGLFEIDHRLQKEAREIPRQVMLADVTDAQRTADICMMHKPHVIFHAAAHKHVPMMQDHPREAMINNFFGTRSIADAADQCGAERFVMISTDKAVNPTSVMGATKRCAELYVQDLARRSDTVCSMVRFGNVLGSACSVVPIWTQQLAEGGPITITDPRMTRFFMTIGEAAALVIQAAALEKNNGHVFVLDMGEPVKIVDMAERFVRLHGLEPGREVQIATIGARPGEKLYEELAYDSEDMLPTSHESVRIVRTPAPSPSHVQWMGRTFEALRHCDDRDQLIDALRRAVPQMQGESVTIETAGRIAGTSALSRSA